MSIKSTKTPITGKILIVEDNLDLLSLLHRVLRAEGYEVIMAVSGEEALGRAEELPDLILMDIRLPGEIDGLEATRRLKTDSRFTRIPIVGMTAQLMEEKAIAGFNELLFKPIEVDHLIAIVGRWMGERQPKN
ncbi:MAG: response regulator [candidate division NC10 bacterium]|nr:response regulator [candidate division NC10 bacterium]